MPVMWLVVFLLSSLAFGAEIPNKCDIRYSKCIFDCVQKFPLDKEEREKCEMRCKLNKVLCKTGKIIDKFGRELKDFFEDFSKEK